jgi:hypothetical protein
MRRKGPKLRQSWRRSDIKREINAEQLASLGAVILAYNDVEDLVDYVLGISMRLHHRLFVELGSRINGMEGK